MLDWTEKLLLVIFILYFLLYAVYFCKVQCSRYCSELSGMLAENDISQLPLLQWLCSNKIRWEVRPLLQYFSRWKYLRQLLCWHLFRQTSCKTHSRFVLDIMLIYHIFFLLNLFSLASRSHFCNQTNWFSVIQFHRLFKGKFKDAHESTAKIVACLTLNIEWWHNHPKAEDFFFLF
jgi:hypothetical protein